MFLHSGAAMHRHEYSTPIEERSNSIPGRSTLIRSAYNTPTRRNTTALDKPTPIIRHTANLTPRNALKVSEHTVRFEEPRSDTMSEDGRSMLDSEESVRKFGGNRKRRHSCKSSIFLLAHPAPTLSQKQRLLPIRPKLLLQLQELSIGSRPKPAIDVLTTTIVVPRLVKKFPRMFKGKRELGANDLLIVRSEDYAMADGKDMEGSDSDEEALSNREILAVVCQVRKAYGGSVGMAEIVMSDGVCWSANPTHNSHFEFVTTDEHGNQNVARWVLNRKNKRKDPETDPSSDYDGSRYSFSLIDPATKRHPIMAIITPLKLEIPSSYLPVSSLANEIPPASPIRTSSKDSHSTSETELFTQRNPMHLEESTKILIQITGIWIALRLGWSPYFEYNDPMARPISTKKRSMSLTQPPSLSPSSHDVLDHRSTAPSSAPDAHQSPRAGFGGKLRRNHSTGSPPESVASSHEKPAIMSKRVMSSGSAFMQRAAARRTGNPPSMTISDHEAEVPIPPPGRARTSDMGSLERSPIPLRFSETSGTAVESHTNSHKQHRIQCIPISTPSSVSSNLPMHMNPTITETSKGNAPSTQNEMGSEKYNRWKSFLKLFRKKSDARIT